MRVYCDHNATAPVLPEVVDLMRRAFVESYGNPNSLHGFGRDAKALVDEARERVAALVGADPNEIIFTGSGTEADNMAVIGGARRMRKEKNRNKIVCSAIEHSAVLEPCAYLEKEGFEVVRIRPVRNGVIPAEKMAAEVDETTALVALMLANNETGVLQPVREVAEVAREKGALMHSDVVQAVGKIPVDLHALGVDFAAISGHKFHGPKGVGVLYVRRGTRFEPLLYGGGHERGLRPSTLNVPGIAGMGLAAEMMKATLEENGRRTAGMRDRMEAAVARMPEVYVNGGDAERLPNTSNVAFAYIEGEALLYDLDRHGIAVSSGSACASGKMEPSHVLLEMGMEPALARSSIRFSLGFENTDAEVDYLVEKVKESVSRLREMSPLWEDRGGVEGEEGS